MKSFKGAAHCWSDAMHNPTWGEMRKRSEPVSGKGGGNDPALANAQKMRGSAKSEGPAKNRLVETEYIVIYVDGTYSGTCINDSCSRGRTENGS